jgi:hypothetical protein
MKELKSKKTGAVSIISDEDYIRMTKDTNLIKKFDVTDIRSMKAIIPSLKEVPVEVKKIKNPKNEG